MPETDSDTALYEKELGVTLTPEQKKAFPAAMKLLRGNSEILHNFTLSDGGSEPATLFTSAPDRR